MVFVITLSCKKNILVTKVLNVCTQIIWIGNICDLKIFFTKSMFSHVSFSCSSYLYYLYKSTIWEWKGRISSEGHTPVEVVVEAPGVRVQPGVAPGGRLQHELDISLAREPRPVEVSTNIREISHIWKKGLQGPSKLSPKSIWL